MSDVGQLYQEVILDHYKKPRNFRKLDGASRNAEGYNPLCGDKVTVYMKLEDGVLRDISFQGSGCAISTASASIGAQQAAPLQRLTGIELMLRFCGTQH